MKNKLTQYCYQMVGPTLVMLMSATAFAQAGNGAGNGGIGLVCRDSNGKISSAQLLDLVEGAQMDALTIPESTLPRDTQIWNASRKLWKMVYFSEKNLKYTWVNGFSLPDPKDFTPRIRPKNPNCQFEVIGAYHDTDRLLRIDEEIFNALSPTHQAAFMVHEILYRYARQYAHAENSNAVRLLVAALFSDQAVPDSLKLNVKAGAPYKMCFAHQDQGDLKTKRHWVELLDEKTAVEHVTSEFKVIFSNEVPYAYGISLDRTAYQVYLVHGNQLFSEGILTSGVIGLDRSTTEETAVDLINPISGKKVQLGCKVETNYRWDYYSN